MRRLSEKSYDLIVCDLKMPKVDGMRFYRQLLVAAPHAARRVIFVTGDVASAEAEKFLQESGCRWLAKPFRPIQTAGFTSVSTFLGRPPTDFRSYAQRQKTAWAAN